MITANCELPSSLAQNNIPTYIHCYINITEYFCIFLVSLRVFFGSQINMEPSTLAASWKSDLLNAKVYACSYAS